MNSITYVGNLTSDPKLYPGSGEKQARLTFSVAVNEGQGDNEKTHFVNATAFGTLAQNASTSLTKGMRIVVVGRLNTYTKDVQIDGEDKSLTMVSFVASAIGPDLRWATAKISKVAKAASEEAPEDDGPAKGRTASSQKSSSKPAVDDDDEF